MNSSTPSQKASHSHWCKKTDRSNPELFFFFLAIWKPKSTLQIPPENKKKETKTKRVKFENITEDHLPVFSLQNPTLTRKSNKVLHATKSQTVPDSSQRKCLHARKCYQSMCSLPQFRHMPDNLQHCILVSRKKGIHHTESKTNKRQRSRHTKTNK